MTEPYNVSIEVAKLYGSLERAYTINVEREGLPNSKKVLQNSEILRKIDRYRTLTATTPYMRKDLMSDEKLEQLEKLCEHSLKIAEQKLDKLKQG